MAHPNDRDPTTGGAGPVRGAGSNQQLPASAAPSIEPADHSAGYGGDGRGAAWAAPLVHIDRLWTKFEVALCTTIILLEITSLALWVGLNGLTTPPNTSAAGWLFRALFGATVLGSLFYWILFSQSLKVRRIASVVGVVLGAVLAKAWGMTGVNWSSNLLNWYQQASTLTLVGGLRGVATRFTLLLGFLGGSLATAAGKHITIDLLTRYVKPSTRTRMAVTSWTLSGIVCLGASWGFFDHIAIENFGANADASAAEKIKTVGHGLDEHWFTLRKQMQLDMISIPHVLRGDAYAEWLKGDEWNRFLERTGFVERFGNEKVDQIRIAPDAVRSPIVAIPEKGEPRGTLTEAANLVFPIGLFIIGIRFWLLCLLTISGHMKVDPEAHMDIGSKRPEPVEGEI